MTHQFIIEHLMKKHKIEMLQLSPEDAAVARSMRALIEDNLYFVVITENYVHGSIKDILKFFPLVLPQAAPNCLQTMVVRKVKSMLGKQAKAQGIGRHTRSVSIYCIINYWYQAD